MSDSLKCVYTPIILPEKNVIKIYKNDTSVDNANTVYTFLPDGSARLQSLESDMYISCPKGTFDSLLKRVSHVSITPTIAKYMTEKYMECQKNHPEKFDVVV